MAKSGSSSSVCSDARPPTVESASGRRRSGPARRVNTSMWRASSATVTASTCWISRKCGWTWPRNRAGTTSAASSFSIRNVITCTTASSIDGALVDRRRPVDGRARVPLRRRAPGRRAGRPGRSTSRRGRSSAKRGVGPPGSISAPRAREPPVRRPGASRQAVGAAAGAGRGTAPTSRDSAAAPRSTTRSRRRRRASVEAQPVALQPAPGGELADEIGVRAAHRDGGAGRHARARASLTRTWAPPSNPSAPSVDGGRAAVTRSRPAGGIDAVGSVEAEPVDGALELVVARGAARPPLPQALELEQRPHGRVVERHRQQQLDEALDGRRRRRRRAPSSCSGRTAPCGSAPAPTPASMSALLGERQLVAVDHAGRVDRRRRRSALTASRSPPTWSPCLPTITSKRRTSNDDARVEPERRRGGRAAAAWPAASRPRRSPHVRPASCADVGDVAVGPHEHHRREVLVGVAHRHGPGRAAGGGGEPPRAHPRQRRVPRDVDVARRGGPRPAPRSWSTGRSRTRSRWSANQSLKPSQIVTTFGS